jgi:hypothetical protein
MMGRFLAGFQRLPQYAYLKIEAFDIPNHSDIYASVLYATGPLLVFADVVVFATAAQFHLVT